MLSAHELYDSLHWLILEHGMAHCKKKPLGAGCTFEARCQVAAAGTLETPVVAG